MLKKYSTTFLLNKSTLGMCICFLSFWVQWYISLHIDLLFTEPQKNFQIEKKLKRQGLRPIIK